MTAALLGAHYPPKGGLSKPSLTRARYLPPSRRPSYPLLYPSGTSGCCNDSRRPTGASLLDKGVLSKPSLTRARHLSPLSKRPSHLFFYPFGNSAVVVGPR